MIPRFLLASALVAAIVLPITIAVLCGVSSLLGALGDEAGSWALGRGALGCGIVWGLDLVCLVLMLAINAILGGATLGGSTPGSTQHRDPMPEPLENLTPEDE